MRRNPDRPPPKPKDVFDLETALTCLQLLHDLAHPKPEPEKIGTSLEYERYVEEPRRQGRDPMYDAMMAEAIGAPAAEGAA